MTTNVATKITIPSSANTRAFTADAGLNSVILLTSDVVGGTQVNRSVRARVVAHRLGYVLDFVDTRSCQRHVAAHLDTEVRIRRAGRQLRLHPEVIAARGYVRYRHGVACAALGPRAVAIAA